MFGLQLRIYLQNLAAVCSKQSNIYVFLVHNIKFMITFQLFYYKFLSFSSMMALIFLFSSEIYTKINDQ